jgi:hypothetical protein
VAQSKLLSSVRWSSDADRASEQRQWSVDAEQASEKQDRCLRKTAFVSSALKR